MIYTEMTRKALNLMFEKHKDQKDRSGMPYVFHPYEVAKGMEDEITCTVALLHDIVEDTDVTFDDLKEEEFPEEVINALKRMTHDKSVPYMDYVKNIAEDPIARKVKLADLKHNSDLSRLVTVSEKDLARREKYEKAIAILKEKELQNNV